MRFPTSVEDHLVGKRLRATAAVGEAIISELHNVRIADHVAMDRREARKLPVQEHVAHLEGAGDVDVRSRIRNKTKRCGLRASQIEARLIDAVESANRIPPIEQRGRNRQRRNARGSDVICIGKKAFGAQHGRVMAQRAEKDVADHHNHAELRPGGRWDAEAP